MKKFLLAGISCLLMISCTSSPEDYQVQINDAVKFYLASCDLLIQYEEDVKAEEFFDTMLEELVTTKATTKYFLSMFHGNPETSW